MEKEMSWPLERRVWGSAFRSQYWRWGVVDEGVVVGGWEGDEVVAGGWEGGEEDVVVVVVVVVRERLVRGSYKRLLVIYLGM